MTITRYRRRSPFVSPWLELEDVAPGLNRIFAPATRGGSSWPTVWTPAVNVEETKEELLLSAELPGLAIEDVEIEVENNVLSLKGEKRAEKVAETEDEDRRFHLSERSSGSFTRKFTLPRTVKTGKISAHFKDGILFIQMPKAPEAKAKKIAIKAEG